MSEDAYIVRNTEEVGWPIIGVYMRTVEDTVIYEDAEGRVREAPYDCVQIERQAVKP